MQKLNKSDLVKQVAQRGNVGKDEAQRAVDAALGIISGVLEDGGAVSLAGFGTFRAKRKMPGTFVNPRTGQKMRLGTRWSVKFGASKLLTARVQARLGEGS